MPPSDFARTVLRFILAVCTAAAFLGYARGHGLSHHFDEGNISTFLSCGLLLLTAFYAWRTLLTRRRQAPWTGLKTPWVVWGFVAAGFVFLTADDALRIHERMDHFIHKVLHLRETALTDRLDDVIILGYGAVGLAILYLCRKELFSVRRVLPYLGWGVFFTVVHSAFDALGNRNDVLTWLVGDENLVWRLHDLTELAEGITEAVAEGYLLTAFYAASYLAREESNLPGIAPSLAK